jgi:hypothetical protein
MPVVHGVVLLNRLTATTQATDRLIRRSKRRPVPVLSGRGASYL